MSINNHRNNFILRDIVVIISSIIVAVVLARTNFLIKILSSTQELELLGSFIAGIFFTSVFTTAPAMVTLGKIAQTNSIILTALFGATGAMLGDLIVFRFIRDRLSEHLIELVKHRGGGKRIKNLLRLKLIRWVTFFVGGLIIASPFPDELGVSLLGFVKTRTTWFMLISFMFNFIGILLIGVIAKSL